MHKLIFLFLAFNNFFTVKGQTEKMYSMTVKDTLVNSIKKTIVLGEWESFLLGDMNSDQINDTAFIYTPAYYASIDTTISSDYIFDSCVNNQYYNLLRFSCNLPELSIENSLWGSVELIEDLDEDGFSEIIVQTNWFIGSQVRIYIYSYMNGKWIVLAENKRYYEDSYKNLVTKIDKSKFKFKIEYFNKRKKDYLNKTVTVKIKKKI